MLLSHNLKKVLALTLTLPKLSTQFRPMSSFSKPQITRTPDNTVTISPPLGTPHSALVVVMHGLGDSSDGFLDVAKMWHAQMPWVKFVLPTATSIPVTLNGGMTMNAWYDIEGLDERTNENCQGIDASAGRISKILEEEHATSALPYNRMVLSGFSQGGAMALYSGLQTTAVTKLGGVLVMSGYLAGSKTFNLTEAGKGTKVLHCHGTSDPMVRWSMAQKTHEMIAKQSGHPDYELRPYNGMVHTVIPEEIQDALAFLKSVIPADETCNIKVKSANEMSVKELKSAISLGGLGAQAVGLAEKHELVKLAKEAMGEK